MWGGTRRGAAPPSCRGPARSAGGCGRGARGAADTRPRRVWPGARVRPGPPIWGLFRSALPWRHTDAGWSSSVARWAHNPKVAGSNPVPATRFPVPSSSRARGFHRVDLARSSFGKADLPPGSRGPKVEVSAAGWSSSVARWAHNPKVAGSNPVPATRFPVPSSSRARGFHRVDLARSSFGKADLPPGPRGPKVEVSAAGWSSSVARWAHNPKVAGSNPVPATKETPSGESPLGVFHVRGFSRTGPVLRCCPGYPRGSRTYGSRSFRRGSLPWTGAGRNGGQRPLGPAAGRLWRTAAGPLVPESARSGAHAPPADAEGTQPTSKPSHASGEPLSSSVHSTV